MANSKDKKTLTPAEIEAKKKKAEEKKRIAALPDDKLTPEQLKARIKGRELAARLKQNKDTTRTSPKDKPSEGDILDKPVTYFHHGTKFTDFGYTNAQKQTIFPPNDEKKIEFTTHQRKWIPDPQGKGSIARCSCKYETYSRKEVEYIENHPYYGKTIFKRQDIVNNTDPSVADIIESQAVKLIGITTNDLVARARAMGVPITEDVVEMRRQVLEKMAVEELRLRKSKQEGITVADPNASKGKEKVKDVY